MDQAGSVIMEESNLAYSKIRNLQMAITANQHIFRFQVSENQRNIPYIIYYSTYEYYNTLPPVRWAQSAIMCLSY